MSKTSTLSKEARVGRHHRADVKAGRRHGGANLRMHISGLVASLTFVATFAAAEDSRDIEARIQEAHEQIQQATQELTELMGQVEADRLEHILGAEGGMKRVMRSLHRPRLGIILNGDDQGAWISGVTPGSAAQEAGLESGDRIVSIAGAAVTATGDEAVDSVREAVADSSAGEPMSISIERDGELVELEVTPGAHSIAAFSFLHGDEPFNFHFENFSQLEDWSGKMEEEAGAISRKFRMVVPAAFAPLRPQLAENSLELGEYFGTTEGVLVLKPDERHDVGLKPGDVILRFNGAELTRPGDFYSELAALETGNIITLEIMRHGQLEILEAEVPEGSGLGMRQPRVKVLNLRRDGV